MEHELKKLYTEIFTPIKDTPKNERERQIAAFQIKLKAKYNMDELNAIVAKQSRTRQEQNKLELFFVFVDSFVDGLEG